MSVFLIEVFAVCVFLPLFILSSLVWFVWTLFVFVVGVSARCFYAVPSPANVSVELKVITPPPPAFKPHDSFLQILLSIAARLAAHHVQPLSPSSLDAKTGPGDPPSLWTPLPARLFQSSAPTCLAETSQPLRAFIKLVSASQLNHPHVYFIFF